MKKYLNFFSLLLLTIGANYSISAQTVNSTATNHTLSLSDTVKISKVTVYAVKSNAYNVLIPSLQKTVDTTVILTTEPKIFDPKTMDIKP